MQKLSYVSEYNVYNQANALTDDMDAHGYEIRSIRVIRVHCRCDGTFIPVRKEICCYALRSLRPLR